MSSSSVLDFLTTILCQQFAVLKKEFRVLFVNLCLVMTLRVNNQKAGSEEHHGGHGDHHGHPGEASELMSRDHRQGANVVVSFPAVVAAGSNSDGKRCINTVEMV